MFSGTFRLKICEATGLKPTDFQKRHLTFGKPDLLPYVVIDIDENNLGMNCMLNYLFVTIETVSLK